MTFARRALQSVTFYRPEKTYNGFTLFTPETTGEEPSKAWLIDMQGRLVHCWQLPGWIRLDAVLLPNGNLFFGIALDEERPQNLVRWCSGEVIEVDWDGNIVWRYRDPYMNLHDRVRMKNGNTLISRFVEVPEQIAYKVKGGTPITDEDVAKWGVTSGVMWEDTLQEITPDGKVVWEWVAHEHLDPKLDAISPLTPRFVWTSWNALAELPDGNIMACSPWISNIYIIDKSTGEIKWRWGHGIISFPHNPSILDTGNILLFDNGRWTTYGPARSRVLEVNPNTNEIEWEYEAENPVDFFSSMQGGCERLPNGNTLICESYMGRFFEVTPAGELVWEYVSPFYGWHRDAVHYGRSNLVFRAHRYGPDYPGLQGKRLDPEKMDVWNRLYGPDAFARPWTVPAGREALERMPSEEKGSTVGGAPKVKYKEHRPSIGQPGKIEKRIKHLGY